MASVQSYATDRNEQAEVFVDFILHRFAQELEAIGALRHSAQPERQRPFLAEDASDIFDHYLELDLRQRAGLPKDHVEIWAQTTCYKGNRGNSSRQSESNKTYEIRETLTEALFLRKHLTDQNIAFRVLHFTLGSPTYTYGWFAVAKENAFDKSIYIELKNGDIFYALQKLFVGATMEFQFGQRLEKVERVSGSEIGQTIRRVLDELMDWFSAGMPAAAIADEQGRLLQALAVERQLSTKRAILQSRRGGADIKPRAIKMLKGEYEEHEDAAMARVLERINVGNPFLSAALIAYQNWSTWSQGAYTIPPGLHTLEQFVRTLWNADGDARLINRRLLMRIHTKSPVQYVQDVNIQGVTEHNLYNADHTTSQVNALVKHICGSCRSEGIMTPAQLSERLRGRHGKALLQAARRAESVNGTSVKPSFYYVEERLSDEFPTVPFSKSKLPQPIAYHAGFGDARVRPYTNLKVIKSRPTGRPIAILKVKYFREPEFPRRTKEEGYVGLTTRFDFIDGSFVDRYPGLPLIMFVDMDAAQEPPSYAVRRLSSCGWEVFFAIEALQDYLRSLDSET